MAKEKRKGLFGSLFEVVEKDPIEKAKEEVLNKPTSASPRPGLTEMPVVTPAATSMTSSLMTANRYTGKFDSVLDSIIEKENIPGPDVYELIMSVKELMSNGLSEDQAYRSAFTAFKSMGLTKEKLVETSNHYLGVLEKVNNEFQTNVIGKKEQEIVSLDQRAADLAAEIERLSEELRTVNSDRKTASEEAISAKQEMDGSFEKMVTFFKGVINKIQTYL